jgi:predicted nucleotidyltransferase component of viral defense system
MQLKAFIKNKAAEKNIAAQLVMQNYVLERLLERISLSPYKRNFILKGGFLISAIVGLDTRATMDLDTTIKGFDLTHETIRSIFEEVCKVQVMDDVSFEILGTADIRENGDYPGIRVNMKANYSPISVPLTVDVTTGDKITPREIEYTFSPMFDERQISIMAYNLETVLSEKIETVVSRGIANTRPRDYYDIYILWKIRSDKIKPDVLKKALEKTAEKRGSLEVLSRYDSIFSDVLASRQMGNFWTKYQSEFDYAKDVSFEATADVAREILAALGM